MHGDNLAKTREHNVKSFFSYQIEINSSEKIRKNQIPCFILRYNIGMIVQRELGQLMFT